MEEEKKLINYERLTALINIWDDTIKDEKLDLDEEKLLMDILRDRREQKLASMRASDMAMKMPFGSLFKKVANFSQKPQDMLEDDEE